MGYPPFPLRVFLQNDCPLRGYYPLNGQNPLKRFWRVPLGPANSQFLAPISQVWGQLLYWNSRAKFFIYVSLISDIAHCTHLDDIGISLFKFSFRLICVKHSQSPPLILENSRPNQVQLVLIYCNISLSTSLYASPAQKLSKPALCTVAIVESILIIWKVHFIFHSNIQQSSWLKRVWRNICSPLISL